MEQWKEFFVNDICSSDPAACEYIFDVFRENREWIQTQVELKAETEPYWHQVDLLYAQMDGITQGIENGSRNT